MAPYRGGSYKGNVSNAVTSNVTSKEELLEKYLKEFRVEQCPLFLQHKCQQHRPFTCFHWHFQNQKRRRPIRKREGTFSYNPDIYCTKYDETTGICPDGDECQYLHRTAGDTERRYHLKYYKTGMCVHDTDNRGFCVKNGPHCAFAHGVNDLRQPVYDIRELQAIENGETELVIGPNSLDKERSLLNDDPIWLDTTFVLANYKTEPCKKPPRLCRQGYACPQYHNNKDKRRSPKKFKYRSTPCPNVKTGDEWGDPVACESGDACQYCHTRTEQQFHPEIYKSTKCNDIQNTSYCPRGPFCAFAHVEQETVSLESSPSPDQLNCGSSGGSDRSQINEIMQQVCPDPDPIHDHQQNRGTAEIAELAAISFQSRAPGAPLRNGSITPPFEENGVASPIERPTTIINNANDTNNSNNTAKSSSSSINNHSSLGTSFESALVSSTTSAFQKNRFLSGDTSRDVIMRRGMFSIDNDPTLTPAQKAQKMASFITTAASLTGTTTNPTFASSALFPSLGESLDSVGTALDDLSLDPFECNKSRKSSGFSEKMCNGFEAVKSRNLSGNSISAGLVSSGILNNTNNAGSAPMMIPGQQQGNNISPPGTSPLHNNFLPTFNPVKANGGVPENHENGLQQQQQQRNSLGLFDLNSAGDCVKEAEMIRLKDELAQTKHKLVAWEEGIHQARNACEAWKKETSMAAKKADLALKEKENALAKMGLLQKEVEQLSGGPYLHALTRVSELRALPLAVLKTLEWNLKQDLKEVENVILKQSENNQWNHFPSTTQMNDWSLNVLSNQHNMYGSMAAQQ